MHDTVAAAATEAAALDAARRGQNACLVARKVAVLRAICDAILARRLERPDTFMMECRPTDHISHRHRPTDGTKIPITLDWLELRSVRCRLWITG